ncbi:hypothetical protein [Lacticaseibacillus saniviri]|uniref:Uncharacterized protein n=1 Tax=Lacticaseibacillus saniviri JCM 17471 = DSM 24301 TaxID=1293598 RepID=A0A0R2MTD7_9LACO|nr:hypothetical protein [Lacticaseibacillus saniviri]KRO15515.1 hypothetical protein IV56_GL002283 [Lacticaseibacillus saniviri JCM 17471 = DSM 24301]MCG4281945.1 hypothetical protein [Lacticaseibacillus saniviri]
MNDLENWLHEQVADLEKQAKSYPDQAFYHELNRFIQEQQKRLEQAEGEIDGRTWNHEQW